MRIDSLTYFNSSLAGMRGNQTGIARLTQQLAADRKVLQPKDDPGATGRILDLSNRIATRTQYASNQDRASLALKYETTVLSEMEKAMDGARALLAGVDSAQDAGQRQTTAQRLSAYASQILDLANTRDPSGNYIFGGFDTENPPFAQPLDGSGTHATAYGGTPNPGGTRSIEVEVGRLVQINDNLDGVFQAGTGSSDLLQQMDNAVARLTGGTASNADLANWRGLIDSALATLKGISYRVAAAYGEVEDVRTTSKALLVQEQNALSDIQSLDQEAAIVELQTRQTTLEATQRAYARISGLSLFNFL